jgi:hypothetical protein
MSNWTQITWTIVKNDDSIESIEHPIMNNFFIEKDEYFKEFGPILDELNGQTMSDYIDFFFKKMDTNKCFLQFAGENERLDFHDWAVELGCSPSLQETHEGESKVDKESRKVEEQKQEEAKQKQKIQLMKKKGQISQEDNDKKKILSMYHCICDSKFKQKEDKYNKTKARFEIEYIDYQDKYKKKIEGIIL